MSRKILSVYKALLRESQKFSSYNFRSYAERKIRADFRTMKSLTEASEINSQYEFALKSLETIKRQIIVGNMYASDKLVIETKKTREL